MGKKKGEKVVSDRDHWRKFCLPILETHEFCQPMVPTWSGWYIRNRFCQPGICKKLRWLSAGHSTYFHLSLFYRNDKYKCYTEIPSSFQEFSNHFMCLCNRHKVILKGKYQYWHFSKRPKDRIKTYAKLWLKVWVADILVIWGLNNSWPQFYKSL